MQNITYETGGPVAICIEYSSSTHQTAAGYQSCGESPTSCGTSGLTTAHPNRIPSSGTIEVTPSGTLTVNEGSSRSLSVRLDTAPTYDAVVTLSKTNSDVTLSPTSLTFAPSNYNIVQSVSISAAQDSDLSNDTDTITLSVAGGITAPSVTKTLTITDDDEPSSGTIQVTPSGPLAIDEGSSGSLSISLSTAPNGNATVTLSKTNSDVTLSSTSLTFTSSDHSTAQTVTVTAGQDDDTSDDTDTITLSASGGITAPSVTKALTITDDDEPSSGTIQVTPSGPLAIDEGSSGSLSISLSTAPNGDATVSLSKTNADVTLSPTSLTFTSSNHSTAQTVTVAAGQDDDALDDTDTITLSAAGGITAPAATKALTITDDDKPSGTIQVTPAGTLSIDEGESGSFSVSLSVAPSAPVTVSLSKTNSDVTLTPASLDFTVSNYSTAQTFTVAAGQDEDPLDDTDTITLSASGGIVASNVTRSVAIEDDDEAEFLLTTTSLTITEGESATFGVRPATRPSTNIILRLRSYTTTDPPAPDATLTIDMDSGTSGDQIQGQFARFGQVNAWNQYRIITITAAHDDDANDESLQISGFGRNGDYDQKPVVVQVTVIDDDKPSGMIQVTPAGTLAIDEGSSGSLSVSLSTATAPNGNVTVSLSKTNADVTLSPTSLTFTASNHSTAQTVTVAAGQDDDALDDTDTITLSASGGIIAASVTRAVAITDDDNPSGTIQVTPDGTLSIDEGASSTLSVSLSTAPKTDVTVSLSKTNSDVTLSPTSLAFTATNHSTAQTVTVSTANDADADDDSDTITLAASGGIDAPNVSKAVAIIDDEVSGTIQVFPGGTLIMNEGDSRSIRVRLGGAPIGNATLLLSNTNPDLTLTPTSLIFTESNHSITQPVLVVAREDDDETNDSDKITIEASEGIVASRVSKSVTVFDDDAPPILPPAPPSYSGGVIVAPSILTLVEGGRSTFSVGLDTAPTSDVTIHLSKTNPDVGFVSNTITFTPSSWQQMSDVAIFAIEDSDMTNDSDTIAFSIEDRAVRSLAVFITDNDSVPKEPMKAQALAIPPPESGDDMTLRIRCKQDTPCPVLFDCSTQVDGRVFEGSLPDPIPAYGAISLSTADISRHTGWTSWGQTGRLGCSLHSDGNIGSQVWTRSGNNVLVNNSAIIRSHPEGGAFRADIESIPSPESFDEPNIRIRCNSEEAHCAELRFFCYTDDGTRYETTFEGLARGRTLHLQSEALARKLQVRWKNLGLTCEVRSNARFTAQVLARTGGGGALVNNSATGGR